MHSFSLFKGGDHIGNSFKNLFTGLFTEYETQKLVLIHSAKYAGLLRIIQILILIYSVVYLLIFEKGYQKQSTTIISSVTLKVKGVGHVQAPDNKTIVLDVAGRDYIIPPSENNAIFIMTNFIQTEQERAICTESTQLKEARCSGDIDCMNRTFLPNMNGLWTGRCVFTTKTNVTKETENNINRTIGLCEYSGWCPPEHDIKPINFIQGILNFRIFIKNFIEFPTFKVKHKNMVDSLKSCVFHPKDNIDCPIFTIDYIINEAEPDRNERNLMLQYGGVIDIKVDWDCNLDRKIKLCKPQYSFARLDAPYREKPFSVGFNFRYASTWKSGNSQHRSLIKAYGLRFIISTGGKVGKFDIVTLSLNIGSLVGIFGLATFVCDLAILHLSKRAHLYRNHVFETVHLRTRAQSRVPSMIHLSHIKEKYNTYASHSERRSLDMKTNYSNKIKSKSVIIRSSVSDNRDHLNSSLSI